MKCYKRLVLLQNRVPIEGHANYQPALTAPGHYANSKSNRSSVSPNRRIRDPAPLHILSPYPHLSSWLAITTTLASDLNTPHAMSPPSGAPPNESVTGAIIGIVFRLPTVAILGYCFGGYARSSSLNNGLTVVQGGGYTQSSHGEHCHGPHGVSILERNRVAAADADSISSYNDIRRFIHLHFFHGHSTKGSEKLLRDDTRCLTSDNRLQPKLDREDL